MFFVYLLPRLVCHLLVGFYDVAHVAAVVKHVFYGGGLWQLSFYAEIATINSKLPTQLFFL